VHAVEHYELIRRKHFVDEMLQRAIAEELGHSRKFVKKALAHPIPPGYRLTKAKPKPTLDQARPFRDDPFGPEFSLLRRELEYRYEEDGTRQYIDVLLLLTIRIIATTCLACIAAVSPSPFHNDGNNFFTRSQVL